MAIDWNQARRLMTSDKAYRGTGVSTPRRAPIFGGNQGKGGQGNFRRVTRQPGIAAANVRPRGGGIFDAIRSKGKKFVHPALEMLGRAGDAVSDKMRAGRLHKSYMKDLGRVAGHKEWEKEKIMIMTDEERAFEKKYLNLAAMSQDSTDRDKHLATAETAWRNKQTSDRLAAVTGFEDYNPGKYSGVGEGARYTGDVYKGQGRKGTFVPGVGIMDDLIAKYTASDEDPMSPHMDITADLPSAISYADPDLVNDDILYGEPGNMGNRIIPKQKPSFPFFPEDYEYPDERQLAPYSPSPLPYISVELGPFDDDPSIFPTTGNNFAAPGGFPDEYNLLLKGKNFANPGGTAGMAPLNLPSAEEEELANFANEYINPKTGRYEEDRGVGPGFSVNEYYRNKNKINPSWNKAYGG